jgi:hypothetical protein
MLFQNGLQLRTIAGGMGGRGKNRTRSETGDLETEHKNLEGVDFIYRSSIITLLKQLFGRAIAKAVSRRLPTAAARVQTRVWSCGIL